MQDKLEEIFKATKDGEDARHQHITISMVEELLKQGEIFVYFHNVSFQKLEQAVSLQKQAEYFTTIKQDRLQVNQQVLELKDKVQQVLCACMMQA